MQALADSEQAGKLADQYQPVIVQAEQDKRASDLEFQKFSQATSEVSSGSAGTGWGGGSCGWA